MQPTIYKKRCKVLGSSFAQKYSADELPNYNEEKFAAAKILEYLELPQPAKLLTQTAIAFEQVEGKEKYYLKIDDKSSVKYFKKML